MAVTLDAQDLAPFMPGVDPAKVAIMVADATATAYLLVAWRQAFETAVHIGI